MRHCGIYGRHVEIVDFIEICNISPENFGRHIYLRSADVTGILQEVKFIQIHDNKRTKNTDIGQKEEAEERRFDNHIRLVNTYRCEISHAFL